MDNIILTPTPEASPLVIRDFDAKLVLHRDEVSWHGENQALYILLDSFGDISEGDYYLTKEGPKKAEALYLNWLNTCSGYRKIIISTVRGIRAQIPDKLFLSWLITNPEIRKVELKQVCTKQYVDSQDAFGYDLITYIPIIDTDRGITITTTGSRATPEMKKAAEEYKESFSKPKEKKFASVDFIAGAVWQLDQIPSSQTLEKAFEAGHDSARKKGSYKINGTYAEDLEEFMKKP